MSQIITVTSEALQATIRRLLPSQQGFGEDLQASNVILPIIDLTPTAEGSEVREDLQTATAFGSQTAFVANNNTVTVAASGGFYRVWAKVIIKQSASFAATANFTMSDGLSTKILWKTQLDLAGNILYDENNLDFVHFLAPGESLVCSTGDANSFINGTVRQIADVSGNLIDPSGFFPQ